MFDLTARLRENPHLLTLLSHYAALGSEDRMAWRDRVMNLDGLGPEQLTALHGELIAFDGIEQNTGHAGLLPDGTLSACYRVTLTGLKEFRRFHGGEVPEEQLDVIEKPQPRFPRKKKGPPSVDAVATAK